MTPIEKQQLVTAHGIENAPCPAALNIKGDHFPCQTMQDMAPGSVNHDGWAHSNRDAEAIWASGLDPIPGMPAWEAFERDVLAPIREGRA